MEYKENEWHIDQDDDNTKASSGNTQVPSSLLLSVLHRLGLTPEQALSEIAVDDLIAKLKSDDWEVRVAAVRTLGKLGNGATLELLASALDDEDASVRAAAVHVLGNEEKGAPLHQLVAALHDSDWHVRETAVLALGKQHVPDDVFMTALHDTDGSVREAARLALHWNSAEESAFVLYGQLKEQKTMQRDGYDTTLPDDQEARSPFETVPWNGTGGYSGDSERSYSVREQVQEYAPQEYAPQESVFYEYGDALSSRGEKIIPRPRRLRRGWWAGVGIAAVLFFLLGGGLTMWLMPPQVHFIKGFPQRGKVFPFGDTKYSWMAQQEIAAALHLDAREIARQLMGGKTMAQIAAAQGVSASELRNIELKAFAHSFDQTVKSGEIDQSQEDQWLQQLQNDPQFLDKVTVALFLPNSGGS